MFCCINDFYFSCLASPNSLFSFEDLLYRWLSARAFSTVRTKMMAFAGDGASWKQDNERHISGKARRGSASIVCDVVINKLNLTCAFLPPLSSFELMIRFPFNSGRTSTDPCPGPKRPPLEGRVFGWKMLEMLQRIFMENFALQLLIHVWRSVCMHGLCLKNFALTRECD